MALLFGAFLAGCGDPAGMQSGGSAPAPVPAPPPSVTPPPPPSSPPPPPPTAAPSLCSAAAGTSFGVLADGGVSAGQTAGAVIGGCTGALSNVIWTQTEGPGVTLLSAKTQAISFDPPQPGTYSFSAAFTDATGSALTQAVTITATAPTTAASRITVRGDQAVREGGKVSVRAWPTLSTGDAVQSITWSQVLGPAVALDTSDPNRALFTAPSVAQDTPIRLRATLRTAQGTTHSDDVWIVVENYTQAPSDPNGTGNHAFSDFHVARVYPYRGAGPYAGALVRCTYDAQLQWRGPGKNLCPLATLPFLHQTTGGELPTVAQVMDRVLVSHDWMGEVFEQFLTTQDTTGDLRRLLNGVTAIVIGAQVRPSFYYALTGAIYLDADNFWLTPAQRDVINEAPDFRSDFDRDLGYAGLWRYTVNNQGVFLPFPATSRVSRDVDYLLYESAWLMYHELTHASDFLPPAARGALNDALSAWDNIEPRFSAGQLPSDLLAQQYPLTSQVMRGLAGVKFFGATATAEQRAYTPDQVAGFFSADRATDEYSYATTREDIAMLLEEFMLYYRYGIRRDVAITDKIVETSTGDNLLVRWGQRGRVSEPAIRPRVKLVLQQLAPWVDPNAIDTFPAPLAMRPGESWNANLVLPAPPAGLARAQSVRGLAREEDAWLLRRAVTRADARSRLPGGASAR